MLKGYIDWVKAITFLPDSKLVVLALNNSIV